MTKKIPIGNVYFSVITKELTEGVQLECQIAKKRKSFLQMELFAISSFARIRKINSDFFFLFLDINDF